MGIIVACVGAIAYLVHGLRSNEARRGPLAPSAPRKLAGSSPARPAARSAATELSKADPLPAPLETDWRSAFVSSNDYFAFVRSAAGAALHGDGTAALYVSRAVEPCELEVALYGHAPDPRAAFENQLSEQAYLPAPLAADARRRFDLCRGFFSGDAFASLPPKKGGYLSFTYWLNAATMDGNPVAEVMHVATELPARGNGGNRERVMKAEETLTHAVSTGDPEAVFRTGFFLLGGHGTDATDAFALAIAGCDLGYDCSADNQFIFGACAELGECATGADFQDWATRQIGPAAYAQAYALAQQVESAISQGDTTAIAKIIHLAGDR